LTNSTCSWATLGFVCLGKSGWRIFVRATLRKYLRMQGSCIANYARRGHLVVGTAVIRLISVLRVLCAGHGWRESLYRYQRCFKASGCGRLGRQAADHPCSALCVVKSCRKDCPMAKALLEAKAAALHPERHQSSLSKLSSY
jgi:hypothetical protein